MANIDAGEIIYDLRKKIDDIQLLLTQIGNPVVADIPEMIESANLRRSNQYLLKSNETKSELIDVYGQYSAALEDLLLAVFDIQKDLGEILKEQSLLISNSTKKPRKTKSGKK